MRSFDQGPSDCTRATKHLAAEQEGMFVGQSGMPACCHVLVDLGLCRAAPFCLHTLRVLQVRLNVEEVRRDDLRADQLQAKVSPLAACSSFVAAAVAK